VTERCSSSGNTSIAAPRRSASLSAAVRDDNARAADDPHELPEHVADGFAGFRVPPLRNAERYDEEHGQAPVERDGEARAFELEHFSAVDHDRAALVADDRDDRAVERVQVREQVDGRPDRVLVDEVLVGLAALLQNDDELDDALLLFDVPDEFDLRGVANGGPAVVVTVSVNDSHFTLLTLQQFAGLTFGGFDLFVGNRREVSTASSATHSPARYRSPERAAEWSSQSTSFP
jgi:hypothetical protein